MLSIYQRPLKLDRNNNQLLMIITGFGGSCKSFEIEAVTNLLNEQCKVCAFFGIAAFNRKGTTLHTLLQPLGRMAIVLVTFTCNGENVIDL